MSFPLRHTVVCFAAATLCVAALIGAAPPAMAAINLTGTWEGTWSCKDVTLGAANKPGGALTMTVTQSGNDVYAFIDYDGSGTASFQGHVGELTDKPGQGASTLIACSTRAGSDQYGGTLSAKVKVNQDDPLQASLKGTSAYEGSAPFLSVGGTCKYSLKRTALANPGVVACPAPGYGTRFVDNGDGTVTDNLTGLQWEKKGNTCVGGGNAGAYCTVASQCPGGTCSCSGPHCVTNTYTWNPTLGGYTPAGTAFTGFLNTLNGGVTGVGNCTSSDGTAVTTAGFAGHCDWRLPTIQELKTIVDGDAAGCSFGSPCIYPIFGPTVAGSYWSGTTQAGISFYAYFVDFGSGDVVNDAKNFVIYVRAVRAGS